LTRLASAHEQAPIFNPFPRSVTGVPPKGPTTGGVEAVQFALQVALPLNTRLLPKTRQALAGYLEEVAMPEETLHDVILALDEACTNVIRHAFPGTADGEYHVSAVVEGGEIRITVEDHGVGFDASRLDEAWVEPDATSGRGLSIIQSVMSSVDVTRPTGDGGTRLVMRKKLQ
jgi:serine/threonine-protein kinase RsbW